MLLNKYRCQKNQGSFGEKTHNLSRILKNPGPNPKKILENRQLKLSWFGKRVSKKSPGLAAIEVLQRPKMAHNFRHLSFQ